MRTITHVIPNQKYPPILPYFPFFLVLFFVKIV